MCCKLGDKHWLMCCKWGDKHWLMCCKLHALLSWNALIWLEFFLLSKTVILSLWKLECKNLTLIGQSCAVCIDSLSQGKIMFTQYSYTWLWSGSVQCQQLLIPCPCLTGSRGKATAEHLGPNRTAPFIFARLQSQWTREKTLHPVELFLAEPEPCIKQLQVAPVPVVLCRLPWHRFPPLQSIAQWGG